MHYFILRRNQKEDKNECYFHHRLYYGLSFYSQSDLTDYFVRPSVDSAHGSWEHLFYHQVGKEKQTEHVLVSIDLCTAQVGVDSPTRTGPQ